MIYGKTIAWLNIAVSLAAGLIVLASLNIEHSSFTDVATFWALFVYGLATPLLAAAAFFLSSRGPLPAVARVSVALLIVWGFVIVFSLFIMF